MRRRLIHFIIGPVLMAAAGVGFCAPAGADTLILKQGNVVEGTIEREDQRHVEINLGFGTAVFRRDEISRVERSNSDESQKIWRRWQEQKAKRLDMEKSELARISQRRQREFDQDLKARRQSMATSSGGAEIPLEPKGKSWWVVANVNGVIRTKLVFDTGASMVLLSRSVADKLGIDPQSPGIQKIKVQVADGRVLEAALTHLESVDVGGAVVKNVEAAFLTAAGSSGSDDGLLGMSFLKYFDVKIDTKNNKLSLDRIVQGPGESDWSAV